MSCDFCAGVSLQAYVKVARMQQEQQERQYQKDKEERRRRREAARRQRRFLEAAFDGNNDELQLILKEVSASLKAKLS